MFNSSKQKNEEQLPEWVTQCNETQERWLVFLDKLETKMNELCEAAIPELINLFINDEDHYKRTYHKVLSGVKGQLNQIRKKAADAYDDKVNALYDGIKGQVSVMSPHYNLLLDFRTQCSEIYHRRFDNSYQSWVNKVEDTQQEDYEIQYEAILVAFKSIKESFTCQQCGGNITIPKIFFIATNITCPHCQTQNTFEPGTQARDLEHLGRKLAEQRTAPLLLTYQNKVQEERDIYFEKRELKLQRFTSKQAETDNKILQEILEAKRQQAIKDALALYEIYLRAMFNQWNKIVPDLATQNEKFYLRQLEDFRNNNN